MKRLPLLVISLSVLVILSFGTFVTTALGVNSVTIRGNLYKVPAPGNNLIPLANQQVSIMCGVVSKTATTDVHGLYSVTISEVGCNPFSHASSQSTFNSSTIIRQVTVSGSGTATIDLFY